MAKMAAEEQAPMTPLPPLSTSLLLPPTATPPPSSTGRTQLSPCGADDVASGNGLPCADYASPCTRRVTGRTSRLRPRRERMRSRELSKEEECAF